MSENLLTRFVPPGTVCIQCSVGGEVANDSIFQINGSDIDASTGRVVDGVLVVFDSESVFNTSSATDVQCMSVDLNASHSVEMYLKSKSQFHIIENHTQLGVTPLLCRVLEYRRVFTFELAQACYILLAALL